MENRIWRNFSLTRSLLVKKFRLILTTFCSELITEKLSHLFVDVVAAVEVEILRLLIVFREEGDISISLSPIFFKMKLDFCRSGPGEAWCCLVSLSMAYRPSEENLLEAMTFCAMFRPPREDHSSFQWTGYYCDLCHAQLHKPYINLSQQSKKTFLVIRFETWL